MEFVAAWMGWRGLAFWLARVMGAFGSGDGLRVVG